MHPFPAEPAHSLRSGHLRWTALWLAAVLAWTGCNGDAPSARLLASDDSLFSTSAEERTAALAVLDSLEQDAMQQAFERLPRYAFTRRVRTEQLAPSDSVQAARERVLRFPPPDSSEGPILQYADSTGHFERGWLARLAPGGDANARPTGLAQHAVPSDPPYLDPRTQEAFRYRLRVDTLAGRPARVIEVHAQPGELGADQAVRHARLYVDPASHKLIGLDLVRAEPTAFFREDSRSLVRLRPAPDSGWVPARTHFHTRVKAALRAPQTFRTTSTFYGYRAADTAHASH